MYCDWAKGHDVVRDDMNDLIERLRYDHVLDCGCQNIQEEAADELELHRRLFDLVFMQSGSPYSKEAQRLRYEITKQRASDGDSQNTNFNEKPKGDRN